MEYVNTTIIGASAAGLSCAAQLLKRNVKFVIFEKQAHVGHAWRNHYERLHLHTPKAASSLPFVKFPKDVPKYPSKLQVVEYLENYCKTLKIIPRFNSKVLKIYRKNNIWITQTNKDSTESKYVIVCTGNTHVAKMVTKPGLDSFPGKIIHSSKYVNGKEFENKHVLVIGFGNSACEIAICLHEYGALPALSVHTSVNVIPRDIFGIPVLQLSIYLSKLPPRLADKLSQPLLWSLVGNIRKYGLKKKPYGPIEQIVKHHKIPLLDIGTMALIRQGHIKIFGDITRVETNEIYFENSQAEKFDAIIMASGYETGLEQLLDLSQERIADIKLNIRKRKYLGEDNLFFCGYYVAPTGVLREINLESSIIANRIAL